MKKLAKAIAKPLTNVYNKNVLFKTPFLLLLSTSALLMNKTSKSDIPPFEQSGVKAVQFKSCAC